MVQEKIDINMSTPFKKELEKYRDVDEDDLLRKLSEEEIQQLEDELEELDPDVCIIIACMCTHTI